MSLDGESIDKEKRKQMRKALTEKIKRYSDQNTRPVFNIPLTSRRTEKIK